MITSRSNSKIREIRLLKQAKHRHARGEYFAEGVRLVEEVLRQALPVGRVVHSPRLEETPKGAGLLSLARTKFPLSEWLYVSDEVMGSISDTQSHQGILVVLGKGEYTWEDLEKRNGVILLLSELQDPGNLGAIFRVAEAGQGAGLVLSPQSIDPYSPKVVRASMGSFFRLPFLTPQDFHGSLRVLRSKGRRLWATTARGGTSLWEADLTRPTAVLLGQEGAGLPEDLTRAADGLLSIPMAPVAESLNVAMAAGLVVYEAFRQRQVGQEFFLDISPQGE
jgi:TrmH family RNA methyltransferase